MKVTGTMINYYFHCKRQCYLFANRINMEDNSENVRIGKVLHEIKAKDEKNSEIKYDNMVLDKITDRYVEEFKKSDADVIAARMQLLFYLKNLDDKGVKKDGRLICRENSKSNKIEKVILDEKSKEELEQCVKEIEALVEQKYPPKLEKKKTCSKCAYYEYCYI